MPPVTNAQPNLDLTLETQVATAMALARASTKAMLQLSPLSHREITAALAEEAGSLERQGDRPSLAAADALRQILRKAA